ncbi:hypothetical protein ACJ41O_002173 [Fusarium nematophilum]
MSGWSWSPKRAMAQINYNSVAIPPRPVNPAESLPSLPALNLPNPNPPVYQPAPTMVPPPLARSAEAAASHMISSSDKENAPAPKANSSTSAKGKPATKATTTSRKRKSDAAAADAKEDLFPEDVEEIDSEDERLYRTGSDTCNAVRRKIRNWIESGAQKVGEFQSTIGVSGKAYSSFMNRTGTWDGEGCDTYAKAMVFFKRRELQGLPIKLSKPKKAKTTAASARANDAALDVAGISLPGEEDGSVPVYDTCDEVRKKCRAVLAKEGMTQAAFIREISKGLPEGTSVSPANLRYFMGRKGPRDGNTNVTFYAAYIFFEKKRIKDGKPKTAFREEMEDTWGPEGFDREHGANTGLLCLAGEQPVVNKFGRFDFVPTGSTRRRR